MARPGRYFLPDQPLHPPRGMAMLFKRLMLRTSVAGFNGGIFMKPERGEPLKLASQLRCTDDARGLIFAKRGRPRR